MTNGQVGRLTGHWLTRTWA